MPTPINKIVIYAKRVDELVAFYQQYFDFTPAREDGDNIIELIPAGGGASLMVHPAGAGRKEGQACVKMVFDVEDVAAFKKRCAKQGLTFGAIHKANGYVFSNAKDPAKNPIQISSRAFKNKTT